jgi:hypothetical protein
MSAIATTALHRPIHRRGPTPVWPETPPMQQIACTVRVVAGIPIVHRVFRTCRVVIRLRIRAEVLEVTLPTVRDFGRSCRQAALFVLGSTLVAGAICNIVPR